MRILRSIPILAGLGLIVSMPLIAVATPAQTDGGAASKAAAEPSVQDVYVVMRDVDLAYETVEIHTIVPNEAGASVLVGLPGGTLVDVEMAPVRDGWVLRDVYYVAGSAEEFGTWTTPWRLRVAEAERFLAASADGAPQRRAEELAPLVWFEDSDQSDRLWGMNPQTYRLMQTLKMMPRLSGPIGGGSDPLRRNQ